MPDIDDRQQNPQQSGISSAIDEAVRNMDFKRLNSEISASVNNTLTDIRKALGINVSGDQNLGSQPKPGTWREAGSAADAVRPIRRDTPADEGPYTDPNAAVKFFGDEQRRTAQTTYAEPQRDTARQVNYQTGPQRERALPAAPRRHEQQQQPIQPARRTLRIPYVPKGRVSGGLLMGFGIPACVGFGIAAFVVFLVMVFGNHYGDASELIGAFFGLSSAFLGTLMVSTAGSKMRRRFNRQKVYLNVLKYHGFATVKDFMRASGKSERFVVNDIKDMLGLGMFPEGSFDDSGTVFLATRSSYEQYREAMSGQALPQHTTAANSTETSQKQPQQQQEQTQQTASEPDYMPKRKDIPPEVVAVVQSGHKYINTIRTANAAIPNEEISAKLDKMALVIERILFQIEQHPNQIGEVRQFMDYYLPTTEKLVNTYRDFDAQPLQGTNIQNAKNEIKKTLDTINYAFESLLDSLFEDAVMDVSTDISVLKTVLAQEGLTKSRLTAEEGIKLEV